MLGVEDERGVHRPAPTTRAARVAVQQVQEMSADGVVVRLDLDAPAVAAQK